jgi:plastocyanin
MASQIIGRSNRLGSRKSISYVVPVIIIIVLIVAFVAGYYAGAGTSVVTQFQSTTVVSTSTVSVASENPTCVTLHNCPTSYVYIPYGASTGTGLSLNPQSITVIIGSNNSVTWENLDTVAQTLVGQNNLFNSGTIAPGASFSFTFTTAGTFTYSSPTYANVKGTVTVIESTATTSAIGSNPDDNY